MNYVLVDEQGNDGKQIPVVQGDSKTIYVYLQTKNCAPIQFPYSATDIEFKLPGINSTIVKNFASGVAWLGAYFGVALTFSTDDTANMAVVRGGISMSCKVTTPTGIEHYDFPNCLLVAAPLVT